LTYPESQSRYGRNQEKGVKPETDSRILLLLDVSPNPFSESTVINYQLAENVKKAALKIYDVQGRMVKALNLATEESSVRVYADEMKNGVYFFTIEADGMASVKRRMVVIK
jgi:trimeric autotransporter adhesin